MQVVRQLSRAAQERSPWILRVFRQIFDLFGEQLLFFGAAAIAGIVRAMGVTVTTGHSGLRFTFGRADKLLTPGFHLLFPFLQQAETIATRSRTLDLPAQRVVTVEGLVLDADANLVFRVVNVRKALIQIDDLDKGMHQMLGLGAQEVLRAATRDDLRQVNELEARLAANLARRLAQWGVKVERAAFPSLAPSNETLRLTQLKQTVGEKQRMLELIESGCPRGIGLSLLGTRQRARSRTRSLRSREARRRADLQLRTRLLRHGWLRVEIEGAARSLRSRSDARGRITTEEDPARS